MPYTDQKKIYQGFGSMLVVPNHHPGFKCCKNTKKKKICFCLPSENGPTLRVDPTHFSEGGWCAGKQTGSHKISLLYKRAEKLSNISSVFNGLVFSFMTMNSGLMMHQPMRVTCIKLTYSFNSYNHMTVRNSQVLSSCFLKGQNILLHYITYHIFSMQTVKTKSRCCILQHQLLALTVYSSVCLNT